MAHRVRVINAAVPLIVEVPDAMEASVFNVLNGEYEAGYYGEGLTILDIGANVGAFTLWANIRWPESNLHAYEAHPGTFKILSRNLRALSNVVSYNVAVYPTTEPVVMFFSRYDGDGEGGVATGLERMVSKIPTEQAISVATRHPASLPPADIIKLDVEGVEPEILQHMKLTGVSLILLEYHNDASRRGIKTLLSREFKLEYEDEIPWDVLLGNPLYRRDLAGDHYGRLLFSNRRFNRLRRNREV